MVARLPLFSTMNEAEVAEITKLLYTRTFTPEVPIVRAGDAGGAMYLIESGEAAVSIGAGKQTILKAGDFFGEMALLERRRHKHDVVAKSRCRVLVLDTQSLSRLTRRHPEILAYIRQVAKTRKEAAEPAQAGNRRRKPREVAVPSQHDEPETI
jgi:voltage-gated potassium channel